MQVKGATGGNAAGFTLLELLIVLILVGLLTSMVVPKFSGTLLTLQAKNSVKRISAMLRYARNQAVSTQQQHTVFFDITANQVILTAGQSSLQSSEVKAEKIYRLPTGISLHHGVTVQGDKETKTFTYVFYPAGNCSGGEIVIAGKPGQFHPITVDFITGIAEIRE